MRILVVDDDPVCRTVAVMGLRRTGHDLLEAAHGRAAVDILERAEPGIDLVVTDIMMPVMDGFELLQHIRATPALAGIPVIVCTAMDTRQAARRVIELGATGHLTKPLQLRELRAAVANAERVVRERADETPEPPPTPGSTEPSRAR
jgi:CheY-like chemotaxis protein